MMEFFIYITCNFISYYMRNYNCMFGIKIYLLVVRMKNVLEEVIIVCYYMIGYQVGFFYSFF